MKTAPLLQGYLWESNCDERSMEDGSDERGEKADRKSGFNALCVVYPRQPGWKYGLSDVGENDRVTKAAKNSSAHEIRLDH